MLRVALALAAAITTGCTVRPQSGAGQSRYYFGIVRVVYPQTFGRVAAIDVTTVGAGLESGGGFLGFRRGRFVHVDPDTCSLIVLSRGMGDIEHLRRMLETTGEKLCIVQQSGSSSPPRPL